jgi:flagellar P-ring protein precursor FlgI
MRVNNTAAVMITGSLPAFAQPGTHIDITAAAIGDASNLQGGLLVLTSLRGVDGQIYAMAQGPVVTGGFIAGGGGAKQTVNHPTVGRVPGGASIERSAPAITLGDKLRLQLRQADFTTSTRIAEAVNRRFGSEGTPVAKAQNSGVVDIALPKQYAASPAEFIAEMERLSVEPDRASRVVINERTGTIVLGKDVRIAPTGIMHGNLTVQIATTLEVSQPGPFSQGKTEVVPQVQVGVKEEKTRNLVLQNGATVEELVRALSSIGATTRDVVAILQAVKASGALEADIEVI